MASGSRLPVCLLGLFSACTTSLPPESVVQLRTLFPSQAAQVLGEDAVEPFAAAPQGFVVTPPSTQSRWARGLRLTLPEAGSGQARFELSSGFSIAVREVGAKDPGRLAGGAVSYARDNGVSFWTPRGQGYEEWLLVTPPAGAETRVASWEIEGATLRSRSDGAVELVDVQGRTQLYVTAPSAFAEGNVPVKVALRVSGQTMELHLLDLPKHLRGPVLVDPLWEVVAPMLVVRGDHAATLMLDGRVLVTGGKMVQAAGTILASAEVYDPVANTWTSAGSMALNRYDHTSTLLANGKVLIAGGTNEVMPAHATAELYDPATNTWSSGGAAAAGRVAHTATRLANGNVLIVGGSSGAVVATADLYNPTTNTWSSAGAMAVARLGHQAALLPNGRVLVAGGTYLASAELYDPVANNWSSAAPMSAQRSDFIGAVLQDGRVLAAGGYTGTVLLSSAEAYTAASNTWAPLASAASTHWLEQGTVLSNGRVLVSAGFNGLPELYDPGSNSWTSLGTPSFACATTPCRRRNHTATLLLNGKVLLTGGYTGFADSVNVVELFDPPCTTNAQCVLVSYCSAGFCVPKKPNAALCVAGSECISGSCVDGVCCNAACGAACEACNLAGSIGTCTNRLAGAAGAPSCAPYVCSGAAASCPASCTLDANCSTGNYCAGGLCLPQQPNGPACTAANQCASGNCVDGVCCDTACGAACNACNLTGTVGTCTLNPAGAGGAPSCAPYRCTGAATNCPASCTLDANCSADNFCSGGLCVPREPNGSGCAGANECASGACVDGVCCNTACGGACDACNLVGTSGTCTNTPLGAGGNPSCSPYLCSGAGPGCPTGCTTDANCAVGTFCSGGACIPQQPIATPCTLPSACTSGSCVDGVCCDTACGAACEACDLVGTVGTCTTNTAGAPGAPSCAPFVCSGASTSCPTSCTADANCTAGHFCSAGLCTPQGTPGAVCASANGCASGHCVDGLCCDTACAGACDSCNQAGLEGTCTTAPAGAAGAPSCSPYVCGGAGADCLTGCSVDANCAVTHYCSSGICVVKDVGGAPCTGATQCASGSCADGVCCDTACAEACDSCILPGVVGTCVSSPAGASGSPSCAPYVCGGSSPACPSACVVDAQCEAGAKCLSGTCGTPLPNGGACTANAQCGSALCVDGFCCNAACGGTCDACNVAGSEGQCVFAPVATQGTPSCTPYICPGDSPECPTGCTDDASCAPGNLCAEAKCVAAAPVDAGPAGPANAYVGWSCGCQSLGGGPLFASLLGLWALRSRRRRAAAPSRGSVPAR